MQCLQAILRLLPQVRSEQRYQPKRPFLAYRLPRSVTSNLPSYSLELHLQAGGQQNPPLLISQKHGKPTPKFSRHKSNERARRFRFWFWEARDKREVPSDTVSVK